MKQFLSFVYKEFCHILRDSRTVLILLVMPIGIGDCDVRPMKMDAFAALF